MHATNRRKIGGSVMLTLPPAILDLLDLKAGSTVDLAVEGDHLVVAPQASAARHPGRTSGPRRRLGVAGSIIHRHSYCEITLFNQENRCIAHSFA